jgi:predicted lipoprotein with Yx(FWY)xxD motif
MPSGNVTATLTVAKTPLGNILVDITAMTVYTFSKDSPNSTTSACTGACLQSWPPLTVTQGTQVTLAQGAQGTVGTITRADTNDQQVTFNGWPVYRFKGDTKPGDTNGEGIANSWTVITATTSSQ